MQQADKRVKEATDSPTEQNIPSRDINTHIKQLINLEWAAQWNEQNRNNKLQEITDGIK